MTQLQHAIEAVGIQKRFGAVVAAADINLVVPAGQRVSLIGSNGAGKTTFVNMLTGYIRPDAGSILVHGDSILGLPPRTIARMGIARSFQVPQLFKDLSVIDNMLVAVASQSGQLSSVQPGRNADALARAGTAAALRAGAPCRAPRRRAARRRAQAARHRDGADAPPEGAAAG